MQQNLTRPAILFIMMLLWGQTAVLAADIKVYKSATCGCCTAWITHLEDAGFTVLAENRDDMPAMKQHYGIPPTLTSCHTAIIEDYIIEGHVPATDIQRLLQDRPNIMGLTAPGMPMQSPGMQAKGKPPKNYDVLTFDKQHQTTIFSHYE